MKKLLGAVIAIAVLIYLLTITFQAGKIAGFETGSEWAMVQADIVAREAGMSLPVYLDEGAFRIVLRQPSGLYRKAWRLADSYDRTGGAKREKRGLDKACINSF